MPTTIHLTLFICTYTIKLGNQVQSNHNIIRLCTCLKLPSYGAVATFKCEMSDGVRLWIWILDHARRECIRLCIYLTYRQNMRLLWYLNMEQTHSLFELAFKDEFYPGPMTKTCMCNIRIFIELAQKSTMAKKIQSFGIYSMEKRNTLK